MLYVKAWKNSSLQFKYQLKVIFPKVRFYRGGVEFFIFLLIFAWALVTYNLEFCDPLYISEMVEARNFKFAIKMHITAANGLSLTRHLYMCNSHTGQRKAAKTPEPTLMKLDIVAYVLDPTHMTTSVG